MTNPNSGIKETSSQGKALTPGQESAVTLMTTITHSSTGSSMVLQRFSGVPNMMVRLGGCFNAVQFHLVGMNYEQN